MQFGITAAPWARLGRACSPDLRPGICRQIPPQPSTDCPGSSSGCTRRLEARHSCGFPSHPEGRQWPANPSIRFDAEDDINQQWLRFMAEIGPLSSGRFSCKFWRLRPAALPGAPTTCGLLAHSLRWPSGHAGQRPGAGSAPTATGILAGQARIPSTRSSLCAGLSGINCRAPPLLRLEPDRRNRLGLAPLGLELRRPLANGPIAQARRPRQPPAAGLPSPTTKRRPAEGQQGSQTNRPDRRSVAFQPAPGARPITVPLRGRRHPPSRPVKAWQAAC